MNNIAIPNTISIVVAIGGLILGVVLIVIGPWMLNRMTHSGASASQQSVLVQWSKFLLVDIIACALLFSGVRSFGLFPTMATALKIAIMLLAALVVSGVSSLFFKKG